MIEVKCVRLKVRLKKLELVLKVSLTLNAVA